jgi:hypothetical protein
MQLFLALEGMLSILVRVLETLFIVGIIGSAVVVILTFVEDIRDIGSDEESKAKRSEASGRALVGEGAD